MPVATSRSQTPSITTRWRTSSRADAEWIPISPIEPRRGREEIRRGYLEQVKPTNRPIMNDRYYVDGETCVVEFEVDLGDGGVAGIVDVFTLNEAGEIARLAVYRR